MSLGCVSGGGGGREQTKVTNVHTFYVYVSYDDKLYICTCVLKNQINQLMQLCTARTAWSDSDQAVRAMHSCHSW